MKGLQIDERGGTLEISYRWKQPVAYFLIFFCLFWDGFMVVWYGIAITTGAWSMALFGIIHLGVGVGLTYYTISMFVNTTYITATREAVKVEHKPLKAYMAGMREIETKNVDQFYVQETVSRGKNGTSRSYALRVKMKDGADKAFISQYVIQNVKMAQELERRLESFLGIRDRQVEGEYSSIGKATAAELPRQVQKSMDPSYLTISDLEKGSVLNYDLKTWEVVYETQYDWVASESDRLLQLASDSGDNALLYLHAEMATTTPWIERKLEAHQMRGDTFNIQKEGSEIVQITYEGTRYMLSETMQGQVFARGTNAAGREGKQWFYISTDKQKSLRMLQIEGSGMSTFEGDLAKEYQFSNILPGS